MRIGALFFAVAFTCGGADPNLLRLIPPNVRFLSGIQVTQSIRTPFGRYVLAQMEPDDNDFRQFLSESGLDPQRDVTALLIATAGEAENPKSLMIAQGLFHPDKFSSAAKTHGAISSAYHGVQVLSFKGTKDEAAIAFLDASTALAGEPETIRAALDRRESPASENSERTAKVRELGDAYDAWFLSTGPIAEYFAGRIADENLGDAVQGNLLSAVLQASGGLKFETDGVLFAGHAIARSEKDADALRDVVRFLAGLVQMTKGPGPKASLADSLQVTTEGNILRLSVLMPETMVERLFVPKAPPRK